MTKPYNQLAVLYEQAAGTGFLKSGKDTDCYKQIGKLLGQYDVNKDFCEKIKNSEGLRYMLCSNLHDARIVEYKLADGNLEFIINCGDCMGKPYQDGFMLTKISVKYKGVKNYISLEEGSHIKDFNYVTHEISYDEGGGFIVVKVRLVKQKRNQIAYRDIVIHCDDIVLAGLSHEL